MWAGLPCKVTVAIAIAASLCLRLTHAVCVIGLSNSRTLIVLKEYEKDIATVQQANFFVSV